MNATGSARAWWPHAKRGPWQIRDKGRSGGQDAKVQGGVALRSRPIEAGGNRGTTGGRPDGEWRGSGEQDRQPETPGGRWMPQGDAQQEACGSATAFIPSRYVTTASLTLGTGKPARNGQETRALLFASVARARIGA